MCKDPPPARKIPVILDTDIGTDIDDTWALGMLLNCPELDLKLVTTDTGETPYRAKIVAKFLQQVGRTDVPVGIGLFAPWGPERRIQEAWVEGYQLKDFPGTIYQDGVQAIVETIMDSPDPVTLLCIGPVPNIAEALRREPRIVQNARFVGMFGAIRRGYGGKEQVQKEYNVTNNVPASRAAFAAAWDKTITPLDTCGYISLTGQRYQKVARSSSPIARTVMENWRVVATRDGEPWPRKASPTLFDCVAVYLAYSSELLRMERLPVHITDEGFTRIEQGAPLVNCAMEWKDRDAFLDLLADRMAR